ncbi:amidohydrolase family protein [Pelomonas sp. SE-A7]|uniref:amidohydrolase family protein n=1 Tax=Pelomonas sp. SE-A7 TaxID=3054953 RepID=UPI00259D06C4|nr:amidohydrolase family protein [Pelomonas sp. SE-A7]MDM4765392.1 amidohydrolase family protein [Pelomonas sp. SE-A7]
MSLLFVNGGAPGQARLRVLGGLIVDAAGPGAHGETVIDLQGDRLLPGLINAHEHLQLNALPRLSYRQRYERVGDWIADIDARRSQDPLLRANQAIPRAQRLLIGGLKNLLSGATTVVHHDPLYPSLLEPGFPVEVLRSYGWSHSLELDGAEHVRRSFQATPPEQPWIIHAAEGLDSGDEFEQLDRLGCIAANTVLVHGLALSADQQQRLMQRGACLVWCPGSNLHLFQRTPEVRPLLERGCLLLGSDSRISGGRDLLAELPLARELAGLSEAGLEALLTSQAAARLRLNDRGRLLPGLRADLLVLPRGLKLSEAQRADLRLVMVGGRMLCADPAFASAGGPGLLPVQVDGRPKSLERSLVEALQGAAISEPGLVLEPRPAEALA